LSPTLPSRAQRRPSILLGKEDGQDAIGLRRIGRIGRVELVVAIGQVDLPEDGSAVMIETAEVVLAVRIVVRVERLEGTDAFGNRGLHVRRQSMDAARNDDLSAGERSPERVVEFRNGHRSEMVRADKVDLSRSAPPERSPARRATRRAVKGESLYRGRREPGKQRGP
jgi:hypothetical protein